jgi:hypothetical protein
MQGFETSDHLDEDIPDLLFFDVTASLLVGADLLIDVSIVSKFHNNTEIIVKKLKSTYQRAEEASSMNASL